MRTASRVTLTTMGHNNALVWRGTVSSYDTDHGGSSGEIANGKGTLALDYVPTTKERSTDEKERDSVSKYPMENFRNPTLRRKRTKGTKPNNK